MKRNKIWFVIAILVISALLLVACEELPVPTPGEHTHTYGAWTLTTEPTATTDGSATRKCACGEDETVTVAKLTDTDVWTVKVSQDATHASNGYAVYTSTYGTVTTTSSKEQHVYGNWTITKDPTETDTGSAIKICSCGYSVVEDVPALSNNVWTKDDSNRPSHDAAGSVVYTSDYGTVTVVVPAGAHSFGNWTNNNDGTHTRSCDCGKDETADHVFDQRVANNNTKKADATCTTGAEYTYSCVCGAVGTETFFSGDGTGHTFSQFVLTKEPTCTETGLASVKCTKCDYEDDNSVIAALGHKWDNVYHPYFGTSQYWDTDTGEVIVEEDAKSTYHAHACTVCGVFDEVNKAEHAYGDDYATGSVAQNGFQMVREHACVCGYTEVVNDNLGFFEQDLWTDVASEDATYNKAGYVTRKHIASGLEYTRILPKLVAPYDNKTYYFVDALLRDGETIGAATFYSWSDAPITLDANGEGVGTASPVKGANKVTMVDATTGKITWKIGETTYNGYVDMSTGIVVISNENPFTGKVYIGSWLEDGALKAGAFAGSVWGDNMAVSYKHNCSIGEHEFNIYINEDGVVTFGVDFVDANGKAIAVGDIHSANYVKIAKGDTKLVAFAKNSAGALVKTDGYEGSYTADLGSGNETIVLDGCGTFTAGTKSGTYTLVEGKTYTADMYQVADKKNVAYYQITITNGTLTAVKPMVTITYETAHGTVADSYKSANTNIEFTLPTWVSVMEEGKEYVFAGWKLDDATEDDEYIKTYIPTKAVKFVATWTQGTKAVTINDAQGENKTITVGTGSVIFDVAGFPAYDGDTIKNGYIFKGWYIDANANGVIDASETNTIDTTTRADGDIAIVAAWEKLPAYVGTYYGGNLYGLEAGNIGGQTLTIDHKGSITGLITGTVVSYNATTQKIVWNNGTENCTCYFDVNTKVILGLVKNDIGSDYYVFGQNIAENGKVVAHYGICNPESGSYDYQLIHLDTAGTIIYTYNNFIYSNVTVTDALGNALAIKSSEANSIAKATTIIVRDSSGNIILSKAAAVGKKFSGTNNKNLPRDIDTYYGTYTLTDADSITFDGAGNFVWDDKTGTYTLTDADTATFDAYVVASGKNTEYHVVTLDVTNKTYTSTKPMVNVSYVSSVTPNETLTTPASVNKNIEITLPTLTNDAKAFAGWYLQTDDTQAVVDSKQTITGDVTYVAKWVERSPFEGTYTMLRFYNDATNPSDVWNSDTQKLVINAFGKGTVTAWNGFSNGSAVSISFVEDSTSVVTITAGSSTYYGVYDATSGVIVRAGQSSGFGSTIFMMVPYNANYVKADFAMFAWDDGSVYRKLISFDDKNAETPTTRTVFIEGATNVAFGVTSWSAKDKTYTAVENLADVKANAVMFTVTAGETTYNYAKNSGDKFVTVTDTAVQGKYTNGEDYIVLNGAGVIYFKDGTSGKYTVAEDGTITALTSTANYTITLTGNTFTKADNKVTITYYDGATELTDKQATPYNGIKYTLIAGPEKEGYVFRGWYESADFSGSKVTSVTPTENKTYYAKYDPAVTLTFDYNGYTDGETSSHSVTDKYVNDTVGTLPTVLNNATYGTKVFVGWYTADGTEGNWGDQVTTSTTLTSETITYYAKWIVPHAMYGSYKGAYTSNYYSGTGYNMNSATLTVDAEGNVTGSKTGSIQNYDSATGYFSLKVDSSTYYARYDAEAKVIVFATSSGTTAFGKDAYYLFLTNDTVSGDKNASLRWNDNKTSLFTFTVGTAKRIIYINDTEVYGDVDVVNAAGDSVTISSALKTAGTVITIKKGTTAIVTYGYVGDTFVLSDGYQGTYTASTGDGIGSITLDGYGSATIGSSTTPVTYDRDSANNKITFVHSNRMYVLTLDKTTSKYTQVQDGYQGTYTLPDNSTITLDGYGTVTGTNKTYVVSGSNITIYDGETSTTYGIDTTTKVLLGKSIFAGLKFTKSDAQYVQFNDTPEISGTYLCGNSSWYVTFTGTYDAETHILTCEVVTQSGNAAPIGSTFTFTVSDGQIVLTTGSFSSYVDASIGSTYTNADFVLA